MSKRAIVKVAAYTRISTDEEHQRYSLGAQEERIRSYISFHKKDGYSLFKIYPDQKSGVNLDRPALQNLLQDGEKDLFNVILVVKMDRLSRSLADQLYLIEQFRKWAIRLEATDEDIDLETPDGITWAQIRGAFNEAERRKISYRTKMGMRKKASLGEWCGGYTPLGYTYDKDTKSLIPDQTEIPTIKEIFHSYAIKKMGAKSIATHLNKKGYRTRTGHLFSTSTIIAIITNPVYAGKIRWGGETYTGAHQPLIDEQIFDKVQVILAQRRENPSLRRSNSSNYSLSGLLHCQECGRYLVGVSAHGRNNIYQYYACPGKFKYGECQMENLPREIMDKIILSQVKSVFKDNLLLSKLLKKVNAKRAEKLPKKQAELKSVERKMQVMDEIARSKIQPFSMKDIKKVLDKLDKVILSAKPSEKKAFLRSVVKTIKVYSPFHIEPYYRVPVVRIMSRLAPRAGLEPAT